MRPSSSIWSRCAHRLFGRAPATRPLRRADLRRRECAPLFVAAEVLEERALLSAAFGSALSIGNDAGDSYALDVATDAAGNSYVTGSFSGTVDFDSGAGTTNLIARGAGDAFVAKYAPDNALLWVQRMGGDNSSVDGDRGNDVAVDGVGNVYVAGDFLDSGDFGSTTLTSLGGRDGFVAKLDAGGTIQWATRFGTATESLEGVEGLGIDSSNNVYTLSLRGMSNPSGTYQDVRKFSPTGSPIWTQSILTNLTYFPGDLTVSASGNVYVAGTFNGTADFDPGPKTKNVSSIGVTTGGFVLNLDTNGKFGWVTPFLPQTSSGDCIPNSVTLDGSGNVVVGGSYGGSVDFDPSNGKTSTLPTIGGGFITKLNSSGGLVWAKALEAGGFADAFAIVRGVAVDSAGSIYATGDFNGTVDLNPGAATDTRTSAGGRDMFVVKLTSAGNYSWAETFGGTGDDAGLGIAVDPTGGVHLVGYYSGPVDFDPSPLATYYLTNPGTFRNAFRLRLRQV